MNVLDRNRTEYGKSEAVAILGATIIDGNGGGVVDDGVILIEGKRITAVGNRSIPVPPHAIPVHAHGKFVIPGLMSPLQWLVEGTWLPEMIRYEGRYDEVAIEGAQLALKGGITTVFDTWGPRDPLIKARSAINEGSATGARIYLCGNWIASGGPYSPDMRPHFRDAVGEPFAARSNALWEANVGEALTRMPLEEVRLEVRKYVQSGIDFVTYAVNVHRSGADQYIALSPRVQQMIVEEAHRAGLPVLATFITTEEGIHLALEAGADMLGLFPWGHRPTSAETLTLIAQRGVSCCVAPVPADEIEWHQQHPNVSPGLLKVFETGDRDHRGLIRAAARLVALSPGALFSPDQMKAWRPRGLPERLVQIGEGHARGFQALTEKGMTPMEGLMTATRNVARAYKVDKDLGTLEPDKFADLVILDRNPLESPRNYLNIHLVMKEGQVIDRDALPIQRLWTRTPSVEDIDG